jgi:hypothetical protein
MIQGRNNMQMIDVLKRLEQLDATNPNVVKEEKKKSSNPVQLEEGLDTSSLKMLAGTQSINECGMPTLGSPMPSMTPPMPASLNMSAGNASEIVQMVRGLMDLAKTDVPSQSMMPAMGAPMPGLGIPHHEPIIDEPSHDAMNAPAIPDVKGMDAPDMGPPEIGMDADKGPTDLDVAGDQEIMDLIKKIRTGEPVKVTTDQNVKVKTSDPIKGSTTDKHTSSDKDLDIGGDEEDDQEDDQEDEGMRGYDNSPKEKVKSYDPNSMADLRDKVSVADKEYTPPGSGDNPLPKAGKKKEEAMSFEAQLFADYKKFVSEAKEKCCCAEKSKKKCPVHGKEMDESTEKEGNKFGKAVRDAKKDGIQPGEKVKVDGKEYPVKEEEKKTMSKAAKGMMKYGKDGMKALAKAGKEGKDLDKVRDKYNKYD